MPGPVGFVDQLHDLAIPADQIVGADFSLRAGQRGQRFIQRVVAGVMQHHEIGAARIEIG